jgi:diguanylate cyclase (GGDEF)-like protein/putative nucleotidyltransferase with HDIG domain
MTELFNRRFYEEELKRIDVERNLPITIIMADVDSLKFINDAFGHEKGDSLIKHTAQAIKGSCRAEDIVARVGGDEFAVVLPHTDAGTSQKVLARINALISGRKVGAFEVSVSFGAATKTKKDQDIHELIKTAEDAMYRNKLARRAGSKVNAVNNIISTLFEKSQREMEHSKRVGVLCEAIAANIGLDRDTVGQVRLAGIMHDIGKINIDDCILNKKEGLSEFERETVNNHPELGYRILSTSKEFSEIAVFVCQHHENWDGSGYPGGLKAEQILLPARIIALAEAYDAMANPFYKKPLGREAIIQELQRCAGKEFDPGVVRVFLEKVLTDPELGL